MIKRITVWLAFSSLLLPTPFAKKQGERYVYQGTNYYFSDDEYDFHVQPPVEGEEVELLMFYRGRNRPTNYNLGYPHTSSFYNHLGIELREIQGVIKDNDVYLQMIELPTDYTATSSVSLWIKATSDGESLKFSDCQNLMTNTYFRGYADEREAIYLDPEKVVDEVQWNSVDVGEMIEHYYRYHFKDGGFSGFNEQLWPIEYEMEDMSAEFNPRTFLVRNPDSSIFVTPDCTQDSVSDQTPRNEFLLEDFIIGRVSPEEPVCLPELKATRTEYYKFNIHMDIVSEEGWLIDLRKMHVEYAGYNDQTGEWFVHADKPYMERYASITVFHINPFDDKYSFVSFGFIVPDEFPSGSNIYGDAALAFIDDTEQGRLRVRCIYDRDDGTSISTPWVTPVLTEMDVEPVWEDTPADRPADDRVFDLTGREVNPDRLTPGIYIRNGRKFLVPNR